jgi:predicted lipoprotein with Yx(FWY)xxD motif
MKNQGQWLHRQGRRAPLCTLVALRTLAVALGGVVVFPQASGATNAVVLKDGGGGVLENAKGSTLYTYMPDAAKMSNCTGDCAATWPPVLLPKNKEVGSAAHGISPQDKQIAKVTLVANGADDLFGAAIEPGDRSLLFVNDGTNAIDVAITR